MNIFLLCVKKTFITAFAGIMLTVILCSCATKGWVSNTTKQEITSATQKQLETQTKKSVLLQSKTEQLMLVAKF